MFTEAIQTFDLIDFIRLSTSFIFQYWKNSRKYIYSNSPVRISWNQDFQSVLSGLGVYKEGRTLKNKFLLEESFRHAHLSIYGWRH